MAGTGEASSAEMQAGGRTIDQVMEDMQQEKRRNPGPLRQFMNKMQSQGMSEAKASLMSAARTYADEVDSAATAAGLTGDEKDMAVAEQLGSVLDLVSDSLVEGAVDGRKAADVLASRKAPEAQATPAQGPGTYVPDEKGAINMWRQQANALGRGDAVKTLQYSPEQLRAMRPDDVSRAASLGLLSETDMVSKGIDPAKAKADQAMRFNATPAPEVVNVPRIKVLPEYQSGFEAMGEKSPIVTSMEDMENYGEAAAPETAAEAVQSAERSGKATKLADGIVRSMGRAAGKDYGAMAEQALNIPGILANSQKSNDGPSLGRF